MALTLYIHPLSSFCHKVLFALYENKTPFTTKVVDYADKIGTASFFELSPLGKIPLLRDEARQTTVPETTIILEYLDQHYSGPVRLFPEDQSLCLEARRWDRLIDLYLHVPMQKVVGDRIRSAGEKDPKGVSEAKTLMKTSYDLIEKQLENREWILGDSLSVADCAAMPALFYGSATLPFTQSHPRTQAYFERLTERAAAKRVHAEAHPFFKYFPFHENLPARFL